MRSTMPATFSCQFVVEGHCTEWFCWPQFSMYRCWFTSLVHDCCAPSLAKLSVSVSHSRPLM